MVLGADFVLGFMMAMFPVTAAMRIAEFMDESRRIKSVKANQPNPISDDTP